MKAEIALNMAGAYYRRKEKSNYEIWSKETKERAAPNDNFSLNIKKVG